MNPIGFGRHAEVLIHAPAHTTAHQRIREFTTTTAPAAASNPPSRDDASSSSSPSTTAAPASQQQERGRGGGSLSSLFSALRGKGGGEKKDNNLAETSMSLGDSTTVMNEKKNNKKEGGSANDHANPETSTLYGGGGGNLSSTTATLVTVDEIPSIPLTTTTAQKERRNDGGTDGTSSASPSSSPPPRILTFDLLRYAVFATTETIYVHHADDTPKHSNNSNDASNTNTKAFVFAPAVLSEAAAQTIVASHLHKKVLAIAEAMTKSADGKLFSKLSAEKKAALLEHHQNHQQRANKDKNSGDNNGSSSGIIIRKIKSKEKVRVQNSSDGDCIGDAERTHTVKMEHEEECSSNVDDNAASPTHFVDMTAMMNMVDEEDGDSNSTRRRRDDQSNDDVNNNNKVKMMAAAAEQMKRNQAIVTESEWVRLEECEEEEQKEGKEDNNKCCCSSLRPKKLMRVAIGDSTALLEQHRQKQISSTLPTTRKKSQLDPLPLPSTNDDHATAPPPPPYTLHFFADGVGKRRNDDDNHNQQRDSAKHHNNNSIVVLPAPHPSKFVSATQKENLQLTDKIQRVALAMPTIVGEGLEAFSATSETNNLKTKDNDDGRGEVGVPSLFAPPIVLQLFHEVPFHSSSSLGAAKASSQKRPPLSVAETLNEYDNYDDDEDADNTFSLAASSKPDALAPLVEALSPSDPSSSSSLSCGGATALLRQWAAVEKAIMTMGSNDCGDGGSTKGKKKTNAAHCQSQLQHCHQDHRPRPGWVDELVSEISKEIREKQEAINKNERRGVSGGGGGGSVGGGGGGRSFVRIKFLCFVPFAVVHPTWSRKMNFLLLPPPQQQKDPSAENTRNEPPAIQFVFESEENKGEPSTRRDGTDSPSEEDEHVDTTSSLFSSSLGSATIPSALIVPPMPSSPSSLLVSSSSSKASPPPLCASLIATSHARALPIATLDSVLNDVGFVVSVAPKYGS